MVTFNGTTMVEGSGTQFTSELVAGDYIRLDSDGQPFRVVSVPGDTQLFIDNPQGLTIPSGTGTWTKLTAWNRSSLLEHYKAVENDVDFGSNPAVHSDAGFTEIGRIGGRGRPGFSGRRVRGWKLRASIRR
jgi:hypothetical protein